LEKGLLLFYWGALGYGLYIWVGFIWIALPVIVATIVFRRWESHLSKGEIPQSWFVFALDSAIPALKLNKGHEDVAFGGRRQYFLYFMRCVSAVVAFLVLEAVRQFMFGPN
jgi:hypothetical protein